MAVPVFKVAITGPESTGKSALSQYLAKHFGEPYAPEFAREYLEKTKGAYRFSDLEKICRGQINNEEVACASASKMCFLDTDITVIKIWSQFRFQKVADFVAECQRKRKYHLHLLCQTDLAWYPDHLRESPDQFERDTLFELYRQELEYSGATYAIVSGSGEQRFVQAAQIVREHYESFSNH